MALGSGDPKYNPLVYTDPSGEIIFTLLASLIPGAQFLLPAAIMLDYSWMTGGNRAVMQGESFGSGAWKGLAVGVAGNLLAPIGGAGMNFGQNLVFGTVEGALIGGFDAALWGNDVGQGMIWGGVGGAAFTTLFSENFSNWTKGENFLTNENVFNNMVNRGMNRQDILNYFFEDALYDPLLNNNPAKNKAGKIIIGPDPFLDDLDPMIREQYSAYHTVLGAYTKEKFHVPRYGNWVKFDFSSPNATIPEDRLGHIYAYRNQGLYPNSYYDNFVRIKNAEQYWDILEINLKPFTVKWWHRIYKIPRRW